MNSYLEILVWTITIYIVSVAVVHFVKVFRGKKDIDTNLTKAIIYLAGGLTLAMLLLYKPFGASIVKITEKLVKRPAAAVADAVMITTTTMGSSVSV